MEVRAIAKYIRVQPRKVRIIADEVRGANALHTVSLLRYHTSKSAFVLNKVLESAIANAQENHSLPPESLRIRAILVDEGPRLKRMQARAMGRGNRIIKKTSHITVVVEDYEVERPVRPHGTKPKPRPSFGPAHKGKKTAKPAAAPAAEVVAEEPVVEEIIETAPEVVEEVAPEVTPEVTPEVAADEPAAEPTAEVEAETPADEKGAE
jgi:large subunit ribosomal protein L22